MNKNYGFVEPRLEPDHFILGALGQSLPKVVIRPDRNWKDFLPKDEFQRNEFFDTSNCTGYGSENCWETLIKAKYGEEADFSERDLGINAGTYPPGNDPHKVAETARKRGLIPDSMLPMEGTTSVDEYYSYGGGKDRALCDIAAEQFKKKWLIGHEWVIPGTDLPLEDQRAKMLEALQYSPLGVALYAWQSVGDQYIRPQGAGDVHWTMVYGVYDNGDWMCFDSYDYSHKRLHKDFGFKWVKRYHIEKLPQVVETTFPVSEVMAFVKRWLKIVFNV
jgi:hypothetical protein